MKKIFVIAMTMMFVVFAVMFFTSSIVPTFMVVQATSSKEASLEEAKSVEAYRKAAEAYRHLGALVFLRDPQTALVHYLKAAELDPTNPDIWRAVAELYNHLGEAEKSSDARYKVAELEKMAREVMR